MNVQETRKPIADVIKHMDAAISEMRDNNKSPSEFVMDSTSAYELVTSLTTHGIEQQHEGHFEYQGIPIRTLDLKGAQLLSLRAKHTPTAMDSAQSLIGAELVCKKLRREISEGVLVLEKIRAMIGDSQPQFRTKVDDIQNVFIAAANAAWDFDE